MLLIYLIVQTWVCVFPFYIYSLFGSSKDQSQDFVYAKQMNNINSLFLLKMRSLFVAQLGFIHQARMTLNCYPPVSAS